MDCECSAPDGSDSKLECTYPKCPFGKWVDRMQPDYRHPDRDYSGPLEEGETMLVNDLKGLKGVRHA